MKNLIVSRPPMFEIVGTKAEGIAPRQSKVAITFLGPNLSTAAPAKRRTIAVPPREAKLLFTIWLGVSLRSFLTASVTSGAKANQEKNATKKPRVANQNAVAYGSQNLRMLKVMDLPLIGLTTAGFHKSEK